MYFSTLETLDLKAAYSISFPSLQLSSRTTSVTTALRKPQGWPRWSAHGVAGEQETKPDGCAEGSTFFPLYKAKNVLIGQAQKCRYGNTEN